MRLRHDLFTLILVASLAACAQMPDHPARSNTCLIEPAAELPVRLDRGFLLVPGAIDRTPVALMVDTGAEGSVISPEAAMRFRLDRDGRRHTTLIGTGGQIMAPNVRLTSFAIGHMQLLSQSIAVGPLLRIVGIDPPVADLVGADLLSSFDVELDLPHRKMTLYRTQACTSDFAPWNHAGSVIPMRRSYKSLLSIDVQVDGQPISALIDSGARLSVMTTQAAQRLGIGPEILARDPPASGHGVDQNEVAGHVHRFNEIRIGGQDFRNQAIHVAPVKLRDVDMLLGADYLRTRHVWLSYATHRMFSAPPGS